MELKSERCKELVSSRKVGIGQIFRYLDILPKFTLMFARRTAEGGFERLYNLESADIKCVIHESFPENLFEMKKSTTTSSSSSISGDSNRSTTT